ncbi:tyrosine-type recombinase/integrase [Candidatus Parcubacteria bacterium]|nr:tyrosine-type recombinase/integrase [Candidatus Parcubacteria bacterium]
MEKNSKPIEKHLTDFLDWLEIEKGLSSKSQENYSRFLKSFFDWLKANKLENVKPHGLTADHVWKYRVSLARQKTLKKSSQNYYLIALRSLLNYFADRDILSLPAEKIKLAKIKKEHTVNFLTVEQLKKLFAGPNTIKPAGMRDRAILEVLFSTGLRIAELVSLNRNQIKLKNEEIEIAIIGKGGNPRTVYFSSRAVDWLRKYLATRNDDEKALFINYRSRKDFSSRRLTARSIEKIIKKYALMAGLPAMTTPHTLRHSFATDLLNQGADLRTVQEFLGHRSITATQIYTHVTSKRLKDIHHKLHSGKDL